MMYMSSKLKNIWRIAIWKNNEIETKQKHTFEKKVGQENNPLYKYLSEITK